MKLGYAKDLSLLDLNSQIESLKKEGCDRIFIEKEVSVSEESELEVLLDMILPGDTVVVCELFVFYCTIEGLIKIIEEFRFKQAEFISINDKINTTTSFGNNFYKIIKALADINKPEIHITPTLKKENKRGRPPGLNQEKIKKVERAKNLYHKRKVPIKEICSELKISRATLFRYLNH